MSGEYSFRMDELKILLSHLDKKETKGKHILFKWISTHFWSDGNERADEIAEQAANFGPAFINLAV